MNYNKLIGISDSKIEWNKVFSLLFALLLPTIIRLIYVYYKEIPYTGIASAIIGSIMLIVFSILIIHVLKVKGDIFVIILVAALTSLVHFSIDLEHKNAINYIHVALSFLLMQYFWVLLANRNKGRKTALVFGYFLSSLISIFIVTIEITNNSPGIPVFQIIYGLAISFLSWTVLFWVGITFFDKIFKV